MKKYTPILQVLSFLAYSLLASCGGSSNDDESHIQQNVCNLEINTISFSSHVIPIFNDNCLECHMLGTSFSQYPYLTTENAYYNLVTNPILSLSSIPYVVSGDPENSLIYQKIIGDERAGQQMPLSRTPLTADEICIIGKWIEQGAKNN